MCPNPSGDAQHFLGENSEDLVTSNSKNEEFPGTQYTTEVQFGKIHSLGIKTCGPAFPVTTLKLTSTRRGRRGEEGKGTFNRQMSVKQDVLSQNTILKAREWGGMINDILLGIRRHSWPIRFFTWTSEKNNNRRTKNSFPHSFNNS